MGLFRRSRHEDDETALEARETAPEAQPQPDPAAPARPQGPWDEADAPEDGAPRVDLGALRVAVPPQTELRVEMSQEGGVVAVTLVQAPSTMQVSVFAAPRTEGIWADVREEITSSLQDSGGRAEEAEGPYGPELRALVPTEVAGRGRVLAPARFVGVDGPRWFLRALLTGPAATEDDRAAGLLEALRGMVVVRGSDPMAVRDPLPLRLPKDVEEQALAARAAQQQERAAAAAPQGPPAVPPAPPAAPPAAPPSGPTPA